MTYNDKCPLVQLSLNVFPTVENLVLSISISGQLSWLYPGVPSVLNEVGPFSFVSSSPILSDSESVTT